MTGIQRVFLGRDEDHSQKGSVYVLSCIRLCCAVYCSPPGCFVCGIFQARILEPVVISYSRGIFLTWDRTRISCLLPWHEGSLPLAPSAQIVYQGLKHKDKKHLRNTYSSTAKRERQQKFQLKNRQRLPWWSSG